MKNIEDEIDSYEKEKELKEEQERKEDVITNSFRVILGTPEGKVVMKALFGMCPLDVDDFSVNAKQMAYNCGRKAIGVELRNFLKMKFKNSVIQDIDNTEI